MTQTLFLAQLRVIMLVFIAYAAGKGWLSSVDAGLVTQILTPVGLIAGPWAWSIYSNINSRLVPQHAIVIDPVVTKANSGNTTATVQTDAGTMTGKVVSALLAAILLGSFAGDARAQSPLPRPRLPLTGNIINDIAAAQGKPVAGVTGAPVTDAQNFFNAMLLPDLQYALKLATAAKNTITADCYQSWIDIINTQQTAVKNADGTDIAMPDPHVITEFEKIVELRNALQPESPFMVKCSPVASMVKKDITGFIGIVISGGAGLATLVPGL